MLRSPFIWNPVPGATSYTIQASVSPAFAPLVVNATVIPSTYTPPVDLPRNVTLHWRVRANHPIYGPSQWSESCNFITPNPPPAPILASPANGVLVYGTPTLVWRPVSFPTGTSLDCYLVQVATDLAFANIVAEACVPGTEYTPPSLNSGATYYWRVQARNNFGHYGPRSAAWSFRIALPAPTPISPCGGEVVPLLRPIFDWSDVSGVASHTIQASVNPTFAPLVVNATVIPSTYTPPVDLPRNATIHWRVRANHPLYGPSQWSASCDFITPNPPPAPILTSPANNALVYGTPILKWLPVIFPAGTSLDCYQAQVATDSAFTNIVAEACVPATEYAPPLLNSGTRYYWRVQARNNFGHYGPRSAPWSFRIALPAPTLISPCSGEIVPTFRPSFDWSDVSGAVSYTIQASVNPNFALLLVNATVVPSTYTPPVDLPRNVTIHWRVRTNHPIYGPSLWPTPCTFVTPNPPPAPILTSPPNNALVYGTPVLKWLPVTFPAGTTLDCYLVQVATNPAFTNIVTEACVPGTEYTPPSLNPATIYYWRVQAHNNLGHYGPWSATRYFRQGYQVYGLNFSPYLDGQNPNIPGTQIGETQIRTRLAIIAPYTKRIRSFGCGDGLENAGRIAHENNLKIAMTAWLGTNSATNRQQIDCLKARMRAGEVDIAVVGSEVLLRGDLTEAQLLAYISEVKNAVPAGVTIPVTTADTYRQLLDHPAVISAVDILFVNYFPYWEGVNINYAIATVHYWHQQMIAAAGGKPVIVSESGWPSCGNSIDDAVPSPANASLYFQNFVSWARANAVEYFYFSALDESWKALYEGPQGACWGIWNKSGILKPGMNSVFEGKTLTDNWTNPPLPGGPGNPAIRFTSVPLYGSFVDLKGEVLHVKPLDYKVVVYIFVNGGWWVKPYLDKPLTMIQLDGDWMSDVTTGGSDQNATEIRAYLIPDGYNPPLMLGGPLLPAELNQYPMAKATRTPLP